MKNKLSFLSVCLSLIASIQVWAAQDLPISGGYYRIKNTNSNTYIGGTGTGNNSVIHVAPETSPDYQVFHVLRDAANGRTTFQRIQDGAFITHTATTNAYTGAYGNANGKNTQWFYIDNTSNADYCIIQKITNDAGARANGIGYDSNAPNSVLYFDKGTDKQNKWVFEPVIPKFIETLEAIITKATSYYNEDNIGADALQTAITDAELITNSNTATEINQATLTLKEAIKTYLVANATGTVPKDVTDYFVVNADVLNAYGWTGDTGNTSGQKFTAAPDYAYFDKYATNLSVQVYQDLSLPNGKYKLTAAVRSNGAGFSLYATGINEYSTSIPNTGAGVADNLGYGWLYVDVENILVVDNTLQIGVKGQNSGTNIWVGSDAFKLQYYGIDLTALTEALQNVLNTANTEKTKPMQTSVLTGLNDAIAIAQAAIATPTEAGLNSATTQLQNALVAAASSIAAYASLNNAISTASTLNVGDAGREAFQTAITAATTAYTAALLNESGIATTIQTLQAAERVYRIANATIASPADVTSLIINPSFESGNATGWTNTGLTIANGTAFAKTGTWFAEKWVATPANLANSTISQTLTGIPNGVYKLTVTATADKTAGTIGTGISIFAGTVSAEVNASSQYTVEAVVTDGTLTIGFKIENAATNWAACDNFRLSAYSIATSIGPKITIAETLLSSGKMQASIYTALETAITAAQALTGDSPEIAVNAAITALNNASIAAEASIAVYNTLLSAITAANTSKAGFTGYSGLADFESVISTVTGNYNDGAYDPAGVTAAIKTLANAETFCQLTNPAVPFDATFTIVNPSFEGGSTSTNPTRPESWTLAYTTLSDGGQVKLITGLNTTTGETSSQGTKIFNIWSNTITNLDLYQEINLPEGHYKLKADLRTETGRITNQHIYAKVGDNAATESAVLTLANVSTWNAAGSWITLSVAFEVPAGGATVRLGAASTGNGSANGWFQLDNFTLAKRQVDFVVASGNEIWNDSYNIIFTNDKGLTLDNPVIVDGVAKVEKTVETGKWYSVGFPFEIASVYGEGYNYPLTPSATGNDGDYWLRQYDGDSFEYANEIEKDKGYIVAFPTALNGKKITFISESKPILANKTEADLSTLVEDNFQPTANPSVTDLTLNTTDVYYQYNPSTNNFELNQSSSITIKPFEAIIALQENSLQSAPVRISLETNTPTGIIAFDVNDPVVAVRYFTLQGVETHSTATPGIYIVKTIHQSQREETTKIIISKK
ncbi:MAG: hypothetical protein EZS26_000928 [Candidatus Ordinivivax streblomastigis]|uniref:T9SS C-terminal target domain-containing protein n=1 Tax=Candidatus Ordinivivax streblomastigis TaxID=2540710 RepID=A0A5M8P2Z9_9BACT|nr:MAG: hypothetical protein EZS26_000928 [Candidatus Ordinivivax streblomastigis]